MMFSFGILSAICIMAGTSWIAAGAVIQSSAASNLRLHHFYRGEAVLLAGFAIMVLLSAYYAS
jgi:hypothetical protein